jgi:DNA primase
MAQNRSQGGISKAQIEEIKERVPIEDVIKRYVKLKPVGKNLFGICPFHSEKTPSFSVNPELNIFKCYGCGEAGDVISFLQKIESLEFYEAIEMLAREAGVTLETTARSKSSSDSYVQAKKAHDLAARYYHYLLTKHELGRSAREYTDGRSITQEAVETFQIGYAPPIRAKTSVTKFLSEQGFTKKQLVQFGISADKRGMTVDKFVDRIMFPIHDTTGKVIGFSGRVFRKGDDRPKYINSPETLLFQKRKNLYGLYQGKRTIKDNDLAILVEGQTDVILSSINGIGNIVAPLGTGTTADQLSKLKRYTATIAIAFDKDSAGENAHKRLAELAFRQGFNCYSIEIPYGNDADECIRKDPGLWEKAVAGREPTISYFLNLLTEKYDVKTLSGKQAILGEIIPLLRSIADTVTLDHHVKELNLVTDIPIEILEQRLQDTSASTRPTIQQEEDAVPRSVLSHERYLAALLLQFPAMLTWAAGKIPLDDFLSGDIRTLVSGLLEHNSESTDDDLSTFVLTLPDERQSLAQELLMYPLWNEEPTTDTLTEEISETIHAIKGHALRREINDLRKELSLAEQRGKTKTANDILNAINGKLKELEALEP